MGAYNHGAAREKKLGWKSQPTTMVMFENCRVPAANLIGREGQGFRIAMAGLDGGRLNIGACSLGGAQFCLDRTVDYMKQRKQFGTRLADMPGAILSFTDSNLPSTSTVTAWDACSSEDVVLIILTTVPCGVSLAAGIGCIFASTSCTVPYILGEHAATSSTMTANKKCFVKFIFSPSLLNSS